MALASFCISTVFPVRGGATISPRVPLPIGQTRSSTRVDSSSDAVSKRNGLVGIFLADRLNFQQREKALLLFGGPDLPGHKVARLQVEAADLRRRNINV